MFKRLLAATATVAILVLTYGAPDALAGGKHPSANPCATNPCAVNPCAVNPCAANPCAANPCAANPCAANPCAANPCAANPCAANPCAANPCAANPCAANPCAANTPIRGDRVTDAQLLLEEGTRLWSDTGLGTSGFSCALCHPGGQGLYSEPYPKYIKMAGDIITLDQMINFCMKNPMKADYLPWNSAEMTALAAYVTANISGPKNPCNPGPAMNPCSR